MANPQAISRRAALRARRCGDRLVPEPATLWLAAPPGGWPRLAAAHGNLRSTDVSLDGALPGLGPYLSAGLHPHGRPARTRACARRSCWPGRAHISHREAHSNHGPGRQWGSRAWGRSRAGLAQSSRTSSSCRASPSWLAIPPVTGDLGPGTTTAGARSTPARGSSMAPRAWPAARLELT